MKKLIFILGASGSGKTTAVRNLQDKNQDTYYFCYFDQPKVPSNEEVKEKYGDWRAWGIARTNEWVKKIKEEYINDKVTIFDVHTQPVNIDNACKEFGITDFAVILLDCSDEERKGRLMQRGQPELISDSLLEWAKQLREEATKRNYIVIDNTHITSEECLKRIEEKIQQLLWNAEK